MSDRDNALGGFLRARRELTTPEQAGLDRAGSRRTPGLRREEVALLAGISVEYYVRLEQGRYRHPSTQVLDALARVLRLDEESAAYLRSLAEEPPVRRRPRRRAEVVPAGIRGLVERLPLPAFVEGRYLDVLAANPLATALSPRLVAGRNRAEDVLLDAGERDLFVDRELVEAGIVAALRLSAGAGDHDERFVELIGRLSIESPRFRALWARHDTGGRTGALIRLDHPTVGRLELRREKLVVAEAPALTVAIYHAEPGTEHAERLALLAASTARLATVGAGGAASAQDPSTTDPPSAARDLLASAPRSAEV